MPEKRWVSIASSFRRAIRQGELYAGARIPSETEIASQWSVSPMTVHRALSELQREGWVVRRRRIGTVVADRSALPLTKIALVFTGLSELPQGAYLRGIEESLAEGYQLLPFGTNHNVQEEARCLERAAAECSAMICYPTGALENTPLLRKIASSLPFIFVDRLPEGIDADAVMTDNFGSMLMGLEHLHAQGHSRIAYFMEDQLHVSSVRERHAAYQQFIRAMGVHDTERWVRRFPSAMPWREYYDRVERVLAQTLSEPEPVTAVACQQDTPMAAILEACVHLGLCIPDDLAILSFNDMPNISQPLVHSVHRLVQRPVEMGNMAARRVQMRLASPGLPPQLMRLTTDLYPASRHTLSREGREFLAAKSPRPMPDVSEG